jgi:hypothetical protein
MSFMDYVNASILERITVELWKQVDSFSRRFGLIGQLTGDPREGVQPVREQAIFTREG